MSRKSEGPVARALKHSYLWLMLALVFMPFYVMLVISFKDGTQFSNDTWVPTWPLHIGNWAVGWDTVGVYIANSVFLAVTTTLLTLVVAITAAYVLGRYRVPFGDVLWAALLLLMLMPGVANLIPLFNLMKRLHMLNSLVCLAVVSAAGGQVLCLYVLRNFIEDMPKEFFECARIDGASHLQQIVHVVIPQCGGIISTLAILNFVSSWNSFILPLITLRDPELLPLAVGLYQLQGAYVKQWGPLMAAYFIAAVPLVVLFAFTMKFFIRGISEGAIKGDGAGDHAMAEVKFENVSKVYDGGVQAVSDVNLTVEDGSLLVLVGPSGCGKSTTLRMVAGLEDITEGRIYIGGRVVNDVLPKDRDIAMVFQNYALYPHMTVYNNMAFGLKLRGYAKDEIDQRVRHAADLLEIGALLARRPRELSGGQAQRVAVGRAIVRQPKVFLFDEPLSNLDAKLRVQMRVEIARLHERLGATMIYVTHDQVEAMTLGSKVAVMRDGLVLQVDAPLGLYDYPVNRFVGGFIGSPPMNFVDGTLDRRQGATVFASKDLTLALPGALAASAQGHVGREVCLGIRPEDVHDSAYFPEAPAENVKELHVEVVEPLGAETLVYLRTRSESRDIVAKLDSRSRLRVNQDARIAFDLRKAHVFDRQTEECLTRHAERAQTAP